MKRQKKFHLPPLKQAFIGLAILASAGILFIYHLSLSQALQLTSKQVNNKSSIISNELYSIHRFASDTLSKHHKEIIKSDGSLVTIQKILQKSAYEGNGLVRFIWADKNNIVQLSSHTQSIRFHTNISKREYVGLSRSAPGTLHISPTMTHLEPSMNRKIITYSIGTILSNRPSYHGTLYAIIDLRKLSDLVSPLLKDCECYYDLLSPKGESILTSSPAPSVSPPLPRPQTFTFHSSPNSTLLTAIKEQYRLKTLFVLLATNAIVAIIYLLLRHRIIRPVSQVLALIAPSAVAGQPPPVTPSNLEQLHQFADEYQSMKQQLGNQEVMLKECSQIIDQLQEQQHRFLEASGTEMQQMFSSICDYANHLEEMVLHQQLHPDAPYEFDDVREMGDNLRHLSECFLSFNQQADQQTEAADPVRILRHSLREFEPFMERRNLQFSIDKGREIWVMQPASTQLMSALTRAMLFTAVRFAEDESKLKISLSSINEQVILKLDISRFRQSSLPAKQQDFSMFQASQSRDMTESIRTKLTGHANIMIAEILAEKLGGAFRLEIPSGHNGFILRSEMAVQA